MASLSSCQHGCLPSHNHNGGGHGQGCKSCWPLLPACFLPGQWESHHLGCPDDKTEPQKVTSAGTVVKKEFYNEMKMGVG